MSLMTHNATGAAGLSETISPGVSFQLEFVRLHLDLVGGAGALLDVTLDSALGAAHDCKIYGSIDISALKDVMWIPERPIPFLAGDKVIVSCTNPNNKTWGLVVVWDTL